MAMVLFVRPGGHVLFASPLLVYHPVGVEFRPGQKLAKPLARLLLLALLALA